MRGMVTYLMVAGRAGDVKWCFRIECYKNVVSRYLTCENVGVVDRLVSVVVRGLECYFLRGLFQGTARVCFHRAYKRDFREV